MAETMSQLSLYFKSLIHFIVCYTELSKMKYLIKKVVESAVETVASNNLHYSQAGAKTLPGTIHTHQAHKIQMN